MNDILRQVYYVPDVAGVRVRDWSGLAADHDHDEKNGDDLGHHDGGVDVVGGAVVGGRAGGF